MRGITKGLLGVILVVVMLVMAGPAPAADPGVIVLYRPPQSFIFSGEKPVVKVDDKQIGRLGRGKKMKVVVKPGSHRVTVIDASFLWLPIGPKQEIVVKVGVGGARYVRVQQYRRELVGYPPTPIFDHRLSLVDAATMSAELSR